jgi:hypothetical protein
MRAPVAASERDLRVLAGMVSDHRDELPAEGLPPSLLAELMGQIRCDVLWFTGYDSGRRAFRSGRKSQLLTCQGGRTGIGRPGSFTGTASLAATPT